jgi:hypothetical protein
MVESEAPPPLLAMAGPIAPRSIRKKKKKKEKKGGVKAPPLLVKLPCPPMPKSTKEKNKKEEEWVHAYLGVADGAPATSNARAQALSSLGLLLLKLMLQALRAFHLLSIPSSKLSKLTLNRKPKC